jgi:hypothetical protein
MSRLIVLILVAALLASGCGTASSAVQPTERSSAAAALPAAPPATRAPATVAPAAPVVPTALPLAPTTIPAPPPAPSEPPPPTATPVVTATSQVIDVAAQAAALLPDFEGDLNRAAAWDHYSIYTVLLPETHTVAGSMRVQVPNRSERPYEALYFRLYPNHPDFAGSLVVDDNILVDGAPVQVSTEQGGVLLRLGLPQPLAPGAQAVVEMRFTARTPVGASGSAYGAFNAEAGVWALASFYPVLAQRTNGEWDRRAVTGRGDLAVTNTGLYDVTIDAPPDLALVTTGVRVAEQQLAHGPLRERFVSGPQRDFFLAALSGLERASTVVDGTRVVSYYQRGNPASGQQSLDIAAQSLRVFNTSFGRYPLAEMDVVQAALTSFLGVEYPGAMLIEQQLYAQGGRTFETTIAHEVAHQWWYSLVGNDVQGEPWLDEGLTSYSQVVYYEGLGNAVAAAGELDRFRGQYLAARNSGRDGPLGGHVSSFQGNYVALVYAKGALFFHALRVQMGDEAFYRFLQNYYERYRYQTASGPAMLDVAQETCGCDLQPLYDAWVNSAAPVTVP